MGISWPWNRDLYGYSYRRGPNIDWRIVAAALSIILLGLAWWYLARPSPVSIRWDSDTVKPGGVAALWVTVKNTGHRVAKAIVVQVVPISPYLHVFSDQNAQTNEFVIRNLVPGGEALATFGVFVSQDAYPGDHGVLISVKFPDKEYNVTTRIRVV